jgi:hypothetical protein
MRTFIFKDELKSISRTYGGSKHELTIYEVKKNTPEFLGRTTYHTSSTMGAISEANAFLIENKIIPSARSKRPKQWGNTEELEKTLYYDYNRYQNKYKIMFY